MRFAIASSYVLQQEVLLQEPSLRTEVQQEPCATSKVLQSLQICRVACALERRHQCKDILVVWVLFLLTYMSCSRSIAASHVTALLKSHMLKRRESTYSVQRSYFVSLFASFHGASLPVAKDKDLSHSSTQRSYSGIELNGDIWEGSTILPKDFLLNYDFADSGPPGTPSCSPLMRALTPYNVYALILTCVLVYVMNTVKSENARTLFAVFMTFSSAFRPRSGTSTGAERRAPGHFVEHDLATKITALPVGDI